MTGLLALYDECPEAVEYDLIRLGLRWRDLGSRRLTWRDLKVIVQERDDVSAITRAQTPNQYHAVTRWLELLGYHLHLGNVLHGNQSGAKKSDFPALPDWLGDDDRPEVFGKKPIPYDEMAEWLGGAFLELR